MQELECHRQALESKNIYLIAIASMESLTSIQSSDSENSVLNSSTDLKLNMSGSSLLTY
jgi:hypothetical protein